MPTMRSQRRIKVFGLLALLAVLTTLYMTSSARQTRNSAFYTKTSAALTANERAANAKPAEVPVPPDDVSKRLKAAEDKAKKSANIKGDKIQEVVIAGNAEKEKERMAKVESQSQSQSDSDSASAEHDEITGEKTVAGRISLKDGSKGEDGVAKVGKVGDGVKDTTNTALAASKSSKAAAAADSGKSDADSEVDLEFNSILKKSPIIIFSKSYCPYSAKAKRILLQSYKISPPPYVVELDKHPLGAQLQASLGVSTGRRTVPNVLINGKSIGGGDDIEALHRKGKLAETVRSMGGKRIVEATLVEEGEGESRQGLKRRVRRALVA